MIKISEIRSNKGKRNCPIIPTACGVYKWYAEKGQLNELFNKFKCQSGMVLFKESNLETININENGKVTALYCIYVGKAACLRTRLYIHIFNKCRTGVKNGKAMFGSTLRRTLGSILAGGYDEKIINDFLDKLYVDWIEVDKKESLKDEENIIINADNPVNGLKYERPLNIEENKNEDLKNSLGELKNLRKIAENKYINLANNAKLIKKVKCVI